MRHAESVPPTAGGPSDLERPLTALGLQQAGDLAAALGQSNAARVLSSPYLRAVQTVAPSAEALGAQVERHDELKEWVSGVEPRPDWLALYLRAWELPDQRYGAGESLDELTERATSFARAVAAELQDQEVAVLSSHGTWVSRCLLGLGCAVDAGVWLQMPMPAVYDVRLDAAGVHVTGPGVGS